MRIIAIIPARGGSKGIPKKNIRLMNGKPLISYVINAVKNSRYITDIVVSTDSQEIADVAKQYGADIVWRGEALSGDFVTLDPVIYDAVIKKEKETGEVFDIVITIQPTSPLLKTETLDEAVEAFIRDNVDTMISVVNKPHLSWKQENGIVIPNYVERKNRQELPPEYWETGAFVISKRDIVSEKTRIGANTSVFEVSEQESIDIDDKNDWILAESLLKRKRIIFRADGYVNLGMGHIYNCITLAMSMMEHDVLLLTRADALPGLKKIQESNLPYKTIENNHDIDTIIDEFQPDVWVNDCLNTEESYILHLKERVNRVVTIEDLGTGVKAADAAINALYDDMHLEGKVYSGSDYVCLRDEFLIEQPKKFSSKVNNVLIMFGGTDPSNLNRMVYESLLEGYKKYPDVTFYFITGIGYDNEKNGIVTDEEKGVFVFPNVPRVTKFMKEADLAITSQGRATFELAAMGIPAIVLSQNEREKTHRFATMEHGFVNLGLGKESNAQLIVNTLDWLIHTPAVRRNMHELMLKCPLRKGLAKVKAIIMGDIDD